MTLTTGPMQVKVIYDEIAVRPAWSRRVSPCLRCRTLTTFRLRVWHYGHPPDFWVLCEICTQIAIQNRRFP